MDEDKVLGKLEELGKQLTEHSAQLAKQSVLLTEHSVLLTEHSAHFDRIFKKLDSHDIQLERIINKSISHDEQLKEIKENMATKKDMQKNSTTMDAMAGFAKKKDQELTVLGHQVTILRKDIDLVKPLVGLA